MRMSSWNAWLMVGLTLWLGLGGPDYAAGTGRGDSDDDDDAETQLAPPKQQTGARAVRARGGLVVGRLHV
jgi:hypothetical protein